MFETLDIMISLAVVFLILSMVQKYFMSVLKRLLRVKSRVVQKEITNFVGENTSQYLIPYLEKKGKYLQFLEAVGTETAVTEGQERLRQLHRGQLEKVLSELKVFLEGKSANEIKQELGLKTSEEQISKMIHEVKDHLERLKGEINDVYDNAMAKMTEVYKKSLRYHTLFWGLLLVVLINADFFEISSALSRQSLARDRLVAQAELISIHASKMTAQLNDGTNTDKVTEDIKHVKEGIEDLTKSLEEAGLQLGWTLEKWRRLLGSSEEKAGYGGSDTSVSAQNEETGASKETGSLIVFFRVLKKLLGLLISGLLICFGAPFWHDLLSSFVAIRQRVKQRDGAQAAGSQHREGEELARKGGENGNEGEVRTPKLQKS